MYHFGFHGRTLRHGAGRIHLIVVRVAVMAEAVLLNDLADVRSIKSEEQRAQDGDKINSKLRKVSIWFKLNKLSLNVKKKQIL